MTAAAAPHAPFVPGAAAAGQGASSAPSGCKGGSPLPCSSWNCPGIKDEAGGRQPFFSLPFLSLPSIFLWVLVGDFGSGDLGDLRVGEILRLY